MPKKRVAKNEKRKAVRKLTAKEKRELKEKSLKQVKSLLQSLDSWRGESSSSSFRF